MTSHIGVKIPFQPPPVGIPINTDVKTNRRSSPSLQSPLMSGINGAPVGNVAQVAQSDRERRKQATETTGQVLKTTRTRYRNYVT